jgi:hypothetical protein
MEVRDGGWFAGSFRSLEVQSGTVGLSAIQTGSPCFHSSGRLHHAARVHSITPVAAKCGHNGCIEVPASAVSCCADNLNIA